jgi:hypothetical protein
MGDWLRDRQLALELAPPGDRRGGYPELFWRPADGTGRDERLLARANDLDDLLGSGWSSDGRQLLFTEVPPSIQCAIGQTGNRGG